MSVIVNELEVVMAAEPAAPPAAAAGEGAAPGPQEVSAVLERREQIELRVFAH
jgi:hypothetical protein